MIDPVEFAASLGPRVFLIRTTLGLPHREAVGEWARRHGGCGLIVAPKALERTWHDAWPSLGDADVTSPGRFVRTSGPLLHFDDYVIFEEPSLNWDSKQYKAMLNAAKRMDNVLIDVCQPMRNYRTASGAFRLIVEAKLTPVVMG
jgi:hypothetical protein